MLLLLCSFCFPGETTPGGIWDDPNQQRGCPGAILQPFQALLLQGGVRGSLRGHHPAPAVQPRQKLETEGNCREEVTSTQRFSLGFSMYVLLENPGIYPVSLFTRCDLAAATISIIPWRVRTNLPKMYPNCSETLHLQSDCSYKKPRWCRFCPMSLPGRLRRPSLGNGTLLSPVSRYFLVSLCSLGAKSRSKENLAHQLLGDIFPLPEMPQFGNL